MKQLKLEDGMILTLLPLPLDTDNFCFETKGFFKDHFLYSDNSDLDNEILGIIFKHRDKLFSKTTIFKKYYCYVLYNDQLYITSIGYRLYKLIQDNLPIINNVFEFKKLYIDIKNSSGYPNYDKSYFFNDYDVINRYYNLEDYLNSLTDDEKNYLPNFLKYNSVTNPKNLNIMNQIFERCGLGDFKSFIRSKKLSKITEKNKFIDDSDRILELKTCLEELLNIMSDEKDLTTTHHKSKTLIQDVLTRYNQDKKFLTIGTKTN